MKYWFHILVILFSLLSFNVMAQEDKKKELLKELVKAPKDTTRLNILYELIQVTKSQPQVRGYYIDKLLKEAEEQKSDLFKCRAYIQRVYLAYNSLDNAALHYWYNYLEPLAKKNNYYDLEIIGKRCTIDFLQLTGEYEKEEAESLALIRYAQKVGSQPGLISAYQSLGHSYIVTYRYKEAVDAFEKAYELSVKIDDSGLTLEILNSLIEVIQKINDPVRWLQYIKQEEECINRFIRGESKTHISLHSNLFIMYLHYAVYYIVADNIEEAGRYYKLADYNYRLSGESGMFQGYYTRLSAAYFEVSEQYDKALAQVDTLMNLYRSVSALEYNGALRARAEILHKMGRDTEALILFKKAKVEWDSLQLGVLNTQTEQVKSMHNIYLLQLEKEHNKRYLQLLILSLLIISILTIAGFIIYHDRTRRKLKRDEAEMRKMTNEVELANQAKERFLSNISTSIRQPLDNVVKSSLLLASDQKIEDSQLIVLSESITKTSTELMQLINNILDLSRLEAGMMRFVLSDVEVFSLIQDAATGVAMDRGKKINIVCPQSALFWSHIDGTRLLNVFNNLFASELANREIQVAIEVSDDETLLTIRVYGTSLASRNLSQEMIIQNEINRMIIHHFEGEYENKVNAHTPYVYFTVKGNFTPFALS